MLRAWQRQHADAIVSEVSPVEGFGTWRACAWRPPTMRQHGQGQPFELLIEAQVAADQIARDTFQHECGLGCGVWQPASEQRDT